MKSQLNALPVMYELLFGVQVKVNENKASEALRAIINSLTINHISSIVFFTNGWFILYTHPPETTLDNNTG